jgi:hypothetical protein
LEVLVQIDRHGRIGTPEHEAVRGETRGHVSDGDVGGFRWNRCGSSAEHDGECHEGHATDEPENAERAEAQAAAASARMAACVAAVRSFRHAALPSRLAGQGCGHEFIS